MDIRLICMDLDGTALRNDHKTVSPRLLAALEKAHEKGIAIAPVTGRQYELLPRFLTQHPLWEDLVVLCNGAQVRRLGTGEVLYRLDLPEAPLRQILLLSEEYGLAVEFSVDSRLYLTNRSLELQQKDPGLAFHLGTILPKCGQIVPSLEPICTMGVEKVNLMCISGEKRAAVEQALKKMDISAVWASAHSMEITHREASKGNGLQQLCRLLDIPMEHTMALGDSGNDESMLRQAGLGIAMGNAPDTIQRAADAVTETNENDGAAIAIEQYALKE